METDINTIDPAITLERLRRFVENQRTTHLRGLSESELVDVILCAGGLLMAMEATGVLPQGLLHHYLTTPPTFGS